VAPVKIKICGLTSEEAVKAVIAAKADYAGFVYFPASPRHVSIARAAELAKLLPSSIQSVSVLVDPDDALLKEVANVLKPTAIQLHGTETPEKVGHIKRSFPTIEIIKAISVQTGDDVAQANRYLDTADMLLFDARMPKGGLPGGNGLAFDWALLRNRDFGKPWFLSGGLTADNVAEAVTASGAKMVDVSSGVENAPGIKDKGLIHSFIKAARA
jgi:phosphoribosylanthranilate isomerase